MVLERRAAAKVYRVQLKRITLFYPALLPPPTKEPTGNGKKKRK